jgi:NDP-sugar pyrophosphorylase family protein
MRAVILAAGRGRRMGLLTEQIPKPLIKIRGKPILGHIVDALSDWIDEFIVVIEYKGDLIKHYLSQAYKKKKIRYVVQRRLNGTAKAFLLARKYFKSKERLLIIYADELPTKKEVEKCLANEFSWLCHQVSKPIPTGIPIMHGRRIMRVVEVRRPKKAVFAAGGLMVVNSDLFDYMPKRNKNGEYYLTSMLDQFLRDHRVYAAKGTPDLYFISARDVDKFNEI